MNSITRRGLVVFILACIIPLSVRGTRSKPIAIQHRGFRHFQMTDVGFVLDVAYPAFRGKTKHDRKLLKALNDSILRFVEVFSEMKVSEANHRREPRRLKERPFEKQLRYAVFERNKLVSIEFSVYEHGCCGASGSADFVHPLNFDGATGQFLGRDSIVRETTLLNEIGKKSLAKEVEWLDSTALAELEFPAVSFRADGVTLSYGISSGGRYYSQPVWLPFNSYRELFHRSFLQRLER